MQYSIRFTLSDDIAEAIDTHLRPVDWTPAYDADGHIRDDAWVVEATGLVDLSTWPPGVRLVVCKERPHPGAQLRSTDRDGMRLTAFVTNTRRSHHPTCSRDTAAAPAVRTVSAPRRTPACATCRSMASTPTASGSP